MSDERSSDRRPLLAVAFSSPSSVLDHDDIAAHLDARRAFLAQGDAELARGASLLAAVAALRIASSRSSTAFAHEVKVRRLRSALSGFDPAQRLDLAALMDAALAREADERLAAGLPPHGGRLRGWLADMPFDPCEPAPAHAAGISATRPPSPAALARYAEAAIAGDVDLVLSSAIAIVEEIVCRVKRGEGVEAAFDALERAALALCVRPAADRGERDDARRTLVILASTLHRRRPLVAAILRRRLALDGRRRG